MDVATRVRSGWVYYPKWGKEEGMQFGVGKGSVIQGVI